MGFFTPKHSWGNVTLTEKDTKDFTKGKWAKPKHAKNHAAEHNDPSPFKRGKGKK